MIFNLKLSNFLKLFQSFNAKTITVVLLLNKNSLSLS